MLSIGASADDVQQLRRMLQVVGQFGHRLGRLCDDCDRALEELVPPADDDTEDDTAQQRADDDGWPPHE